MWQDQHGIEGGRPAAQGRDPVQHTEAAGMQDNVAVHGLALLRKRQKLRHQETQEQSYCDPAQEQHMQHQHQQGYDQVGPDMSGMVGLAAVAGGILMGQPLQLPGQHLYPHHASSGRLLHVQPGDGRQKQHSNQQQFDVHACVHSVAEAAAGGLEEGDEVEDEAEENVEDEELTASEEGEGGAAGPPKGAVALHPARCIPAFNPVVGGLKQYHYTCLVWCMRGLCPLYDRPCMGTRGG